MNINITIYEQIATEIQGAIAEQWLTARMDAIFYSDSITFLGEYTRLFDGKDRSFGTSKTAQLAFRKLRELCKRDEQPVWGQASFEITSSGQFKMTYGYENCDKNGDTQFDEDAYIRDDEERRRRLTSE